jgi:diacylglycerol kinase (ATP)
MSYITREFHRVWVRAKLSCEGIRITWKEESSFSQWVALNIVSAGATFAVTMTPAERAIIIGFGLLILVGELFNTAVEAAIDLTTEEIHPLAKKAKDTACAAVALLAVTTGIVWVIILIPKLL